MSVLVIVSALVAGVAGGILGCLIYAYTERRMRQQKIEDKAQAIARTKVQRQLHDANRTTMPRKDTTGPATIHKMKNSRRPRPYRKS